MNNTWEIIEEGVGYAGDLHDLNGRRVIVIVYNRKAYFARCTVENYYVNLDDFDKIFNDLEFELVAEYSSNGVVFREDMQELMDPYELEDIAIKIKQTKL